jgi:hypothetical protein
MPPFDATEFNVVAAALLQSADGAKQSFIRTAIGRSYYSQYGYLRSKIEALCPGSFGEQGWHSQLGRVCGDSASKAIRQIGQGLAHLRSLRRDADYVPEREIPREDAVGAVDVANDLKEKIRNLSNDDIAAVQKELVRLIDHVRAGTKARRWS